MAQKKWDSVIDWEIQERDVELVFKIYNNNLIEWMIEANHEI